MTKAWLEQKVITVKKWNAHYRVVSWINPKLPLTREQLDQDIALVKPFKHDKTTTVAKVEIDQVSLVLKRYNPRSFGHKIKRALRQSRAQRCWQMTYVFAESGLNVSAPAFMFEERIFFIRKYAYFATRYLPGRELLQVLPTMNDTQKHKVVQSFKDAMEIMKKHKISHGDLKASNLLWVDEQIYFIDLDAAKVHDSFSSWNRANKRDRKRFLKNWRDYPEILKLFSWL